MENVASLLLCATKMESSGHNCGTWGTCCLLQLRRFAHAHSSKPISTTTTMPKFFGRVHQQHQVVCRQFFGTFSSNTCHADSHASRASRTPHTQLVASRKGSVKYHILKLFLSFREAQTFHQTTTSSLSMKPMARNSASTTMLRLHTYKSHIKRHKITGFHYVVKTKTRSKASPEIKLPNDFSKSLICLTISRVVVKASF